MRILAPIGSLVAVFMLLMAAPYISAQAADDDIPTVAVLDFTGLMMGQGGNSAPLGKAVSSMLITELTDRPGLRVIERYRLQDLLTEQKLALSGRVDESTAVQIGKILGAQYVIHGQVTSILDQLRMDMRAIDVETSEVIEAQKMTDRTSELLSVVVRMADLFAASLDLEPPSSRVQMEAIPTGATIEFSRGVDFEDKGDTAKALEHYRNALKIHPNHRAAKSAIARLESTGEGK
ncbi:MAG: FlgO family outer membrane protein [Longimicrobiales bacterium]